MIRHPGGARPSIGQDSADRSGNISHRRLGGSELAVAGTVFSDCGAQYSVQRAAADVERPRPCGSRDTLICRLIPPR
jgi:hypothetical protein